MGPANRLRRGCREEASAIPDEPKRDDDRERTRVAVGNEEPVVEMGEIDQTERRDEDVPEGDDGRECTRDEDESGSCVSHFLG